VSIETTDPGVAAYYSYKTKRLVLGSALKGLDTSIIEFQSKIPQYIQNIGSIRENDFYQKIFGYQDPCSIVVHELEHARRGANHDSTGAHDDVTLAIFGMPSKTYGYFEIANVVYLKLVEERLIKVWLIAISSIIIE